MQDDIHITSSEIGEYVYCPRAWWLRRNQLGETTPQMVSGTAAHNRINIQLDSIGIRKIIILVLIVLIVTLLIALILLNYIL